MGLEIKAPFQQKSLNMSWKMIQFDSIVRWKNNKIKKKE